MACVDSCLTDYIGILGCGRATPNSCLYINSLPGMSVINFDRLTTEEKPTYLQIWDDIQLRAIKRFQIDLYGILNKRWKIDTISNSINLGRKYDTTNITAAAADYRGFVKDLDYGMDNELVKTSTLQTHYIQTLSFYSPIVQANTSIKIFDVDLGTVIDSFTFDAVIGWNVVQVNKNYTERRIFVGVDSTNINSVELIIPTTTMWKWYDVVRGASMTIAGGVSTLVYNNNTFGLSATFGTRCKWDSLVCANLDVFAESLWYCLGSETMVEALVSGRTNIVTTDRKRNEYLKTEVYDVRYQQSLEQAALNIEMDQSDICIECNEPITIRESNSFFPDDRIYFI
jgi:hypothetical protein